MSAMRLEATSGPDNLQTPLRDRFLRGNPSLS